MSREKPYQEAAMWAYQYAGGLCFVYDLQERDTVPLLDVLSALAEGKPPSVQWPAQVPSYVARIRPASPAMGLTEPASPPAADVELIAGDANREPNREAGR